MNIYELHKSEKGKAESGKYQILENGVCCGVYFNKKHAVNDFNKFIALDRLNWVGAEVNAV